MSLCYTDDTLRRLIDEDLDPKVFEEMERHIEACARCAAGLERIGRVDSGSGRLMASLLANYFNKLPDVPGFEILEELGRGNWGLVYLARKIGQTRLSALKLMPQSAFPSDGPNDRRRWNREARAVSSVRHPNVVTLYDYGEVGRWFFLSFEYVPGGPLSRRLPPALPPRATAELLEKTARAVEHLHASGLLHLDLKPSNILLDGPTGALWGQIVPKVSDFGLSLSNEDMATPETSLNGPRGTPSYMAPEQTDDHRGKIGPATDVYSLGAVLYEMLTGRPPFRGPTAEILAMVRNQPPERPRHRNPNIPRDLETIVLKCLEKSPSRRYPTAADLADELTRWLDGRPILARPVPLVERTARLCRRNPVVASLCLTLVLTAAVAFGVVLNSLSQKKLALAAVSQALGRQQAARQAAEQSLESAYALASRLCEVLLRRGSKDNPLFGEELEVTAALLREQIARTESIGDRHPELLRMMSELDGHLAEILNAAGRHEESRALAVERVEFARRAHEAVPSDTLARAHLVAALVLQAKFAFDDHLPEVAIAAQDQAAALLLGHSASTTSHNTFDSYWEHGALRLSIEYRRNPELPGREARFIAWNRALNAHVETALRTGAVDPNRPDVALFQACLLADSGNWTAARQLFSRATSTKLDEWGDAPGFLWNMDIGLDAWGVREIHRWVAEDECSERGPEPLETQSAQLGALFDSLKVVGPPIPRSYQILTELSMYATHQRGLARLDRAERAARFILALANRMLRDSPSDPSGHFFMSQFHVQESKNAWKRDDIATVRASLTASIASLRRALEVDPVNETVRSGIIDQSKRLAALPPP